MAKLLYDSLPAQERQKIEHMLRSMLLDTKQRECVAELFLDVLAPSERLMIARRLQVAKRLLQGVPYPEIRGELRVGLDLIRHVHRWLDGKIDAYRSVIPAILDVEQKRSAGGKKTEKDKRIHYDHLSFTGIRKRYPAAYLLVNMLLDNEW